jgi:endonuclease/exonuclease/phosphatase family metal-dependent hydrolase
MLTYKRVFAPVLAVATVISSAALIQGADAAGPATPTQAERRADVFKMATFNVLGGSHSRGTGKRSGASRTAGALRYINKHGVSVVGLQELEGKQYAAFLRGTKGRWAVVGAPSRSGKSNDPRNSIAYNKSRFQLVSKSSLAIPYFHGKRVNIPVVGLRSRSTGRSFVMINTHNAANSHGSAQRYRNKATRRQVALVKRLRAHGETVFVTGDMNEKKPYFCKMTRSGAMHAASGGSRGGRCQSPRVNGIDWIFGSNDVTFSNWTSDRSTRSAGVSDHPIVVATVTLGR